MSEENVANTKMHKWCYNSNSDKQNEMVKNLKLFQACKQVFLEQFLKQKFGVPWPPISLRKHLCCLTLARLQ